MRYLLLSLSLLPGCGLDAPPAPQPRPICAPVRVPMNQRLDEAPVGRRIDGAIVNPRILRAVGAPVPAPAADLGPADPCAR